MDVTVSGMSKSIRAYFGKMSGRKRLMLVGIAALVFIGAIVLTKYLDAASYTVLYRGLDASESVEVVNMLESAGVDYRLESDGTIMVSRDDEASVRMQLAASGFPNSTLSYDIFTSQSDLMTTDYEKRQYLIFQLQDRLQDALKTLSGVKNAIVTLNVATDDSYVLKSDKTESSAAVVLDLYSYAQLTAGQIRGVEELVAKSVPGLEADNVIIVDSEGTILNDAASSTNAGLADSQMELVNQINALYEDKILRFLEPVFGSDGLSVSVSTQIDFQQKSSEQTVYTPVIGDNGIISKQDMDKQGIGDSGSTASGVAGTESNVGTATYEEGATVAPSATAAADATASAEATATADAGSYSEVSTTEYLVNKLVENVLDNGGQIEDMTVSILINTDTLTSEAVEQYKEMVAFSVGIDPEKVYISYAEFLPQPEVTIPAYDETQEQALGFTLTKEMLIYGGAGLGGLLLLIIILAILMGGRRRRRAASAPAPEQEPVREQEKAPLPDEIILNETREQGLKRQVKDFASTNPEIVAQLLRAWMKEEPK